MSVLTAGLTRGYSSFMKRATITETKNRLSALIDRVRHGDTVLIMDRGVPVARLTSALGDAPDDAEGRLARLERRGVLRRAASAPPRALILTRPPRPTRGRSALAALLEERRQGR